MKSIVIFSALLLFVLTVGGFGAAKPESVTGTEATELSFSVYQLHYGESAQGSLIQDEWLKMMESHMGMKLNIKWTELPPNEYVEKQNIYLGSVR